MKVTISKCAAFLVILMALALFGAGAGDEAVAKPPGGGGKCGECPCNPEIVLPDGTVCWLESCHLLSPRDCYWDCHYVCPFPG